MLEFFNKFQGVKCNSRHSHPFQKCEFLNRSACTVPIDLGSFCKRYQYY